MLIKWCAKVDYMLANMLIMCIYIAAPSHEIALIVLHIVARDINGTQLTADNKTKLGCASDYRRITNEIMGHGSLGFECNYWSKKKK